MKPTAPSPPRLLTIAAPLYAELVLTIAVGLAGTALAARQSDAAAAGFAMAHHVLALLMLLFRVVGAGISVVVAQALGARRPDQADAVARACVGAASWFGGGAAVLALAGAAPLLGLLNTPPEVLAHALPLLRQLAPVLLLDAWFACGASVLRAHLLVRQTLVLIRAMQGLHLGLALALMPDLGLGGYTVALAISRVAGLAALAWVAANRLGLRLRLADLLQWRGATLAPVLRIGAPGAAENLGWRLAYLASLAAVGRLGAAALAVQAYVNQMAHLVLLSALAGALAAEVLVGHHIGAGRLRDADRLVRRTLTACLALAAVAALVVALAGLPLMRLFTADPALATAAAALLWWLLPLETGRTFNLVVINALRAAGDARFPVLAGAASMLLVLAGGSWLLGVHLGLGLAGVWLAYAADEWLRGLIMWWRWRGLHWVPHARAARRRLRRGPSTTPDAATHPNTDPTRSPTAS
ncbi:MAG: MATE family efflux transporter [Aquabacterium sp.]